MAFEQDNKCNMAAMRAKRCSGTAASDAACTIRPEGRRGCPTTNENND